MSSCRRLLLYRVKSPVVVKSNSQVAKLTATRKVRSPITQSKCQVAKPKSPILRNITVTIDIL